MVNLMQRFVKKLIVKFGVIILLLSFLPVARIQAAGGINRVSASVAYPTTGNTIEYYVQDISDINDVIAIDWDPWDTTFQENTVYSVRITTAPKSGYSYMDNTEFYINGVLANVIYCVPEEAQFWISFPATAPVNPTYFLTTQVYGGNGQISGSRSDLPYGHTETVIFYPEVGYEIDYVLVNGMEWGVMSNVLDVPIYENTTVIVRYKPIYVYKPYYNLYLNVPNGHGKILTDSTYVEEGTYANLIFQPDDGYELDWVTVNDVYTGVMSNVLGFEVYSDTVVNASFKSIYSQITTEVIGGHGTIYANSSAYTGAYETIYFEPEYGYELDYVTVNGVGTEVYGNTLGLYINEAANIKAKFKPSKHALTINNLTGHGYAYGDSTSYSHGTTGTITFVPDDGYEIDKVTVNSTPVTLTNNQLAVTFVEDGYIDVSFKESPRYKLTTQVTGGHGTISDSQAKIKQGTIQTIYFTPDTDYEIDYVTVNGTWTYVTGNRLDLTMNADANVVVAYKRKTHYYTLTTSVSDGHGTISSGNSSVAENTTETIYFTPDTGYEIDQVTVNGQTTNPNGNSLNLTITSDTNVIVSYKKKAIYYSLTTSVSGGHGSISQGKNQVVENSNERIQIKPDDGYQIDQVTVNGKAVPVVGDTLSVTMNSNQDVIVSFKEIIIDQTVTYDLRTKVDGGHGTISSSKSSLHSGQTETIQFTPDQGYEIQQITVNGTVTAVSGNELNLVMNESYEVVVTYQKIEDAVTTQAPITQPADQQSGSNTMLLWIGGGIIALLLAVVALLLGLLKKKDQKNH